MTHALLLLVAVLPAAPAPVPRNTPLLGRWQVVSGQASSERGRWLADVDAVHFGKATTFRNRAFPSMAMLEMKSGKVLTLEYWLPPPRLSEIDLTLVTRGPGQKFRGTYEFEGKTLRLCLSLPGEARPRSPALAKGANQVLLVLERKP